MDGRSCGSVYDYATRRPGVSKSGFPRQLSRCIVTGKVFVACIVSHSDVLIQRDFETLQ